MKNQQALSVTPIITSLLDTDAYKLHMQQAVFHLYPTAQVTAEFHCRLDEDLSSYAGDLKAQVAKLCELKFQTDELKYLSDLPFFQADYLAYLQDFQLKPKTIQISTEQGQLSIVLSGSWLDVILWEVPLLAIVSELRNAHRYPNHGVTQALDRLEEKLEKLKSQVNPSDLSEFTLVDFGTRRRFSKAVQEAVVDKLIQDFPAFQGTSNYYLAFKKGLTPVGTQAHEWFQAHQQLSSNLQDSQQMALQAWLTEYPDSLGIALTDCINMDAFLRDFNLEFATRFTGLRHDSGDPIAWGERAIAHYKALGIDPKNKLLVFSDGLSLEKAIEIYQHFKGKIPTSFGIGTKLTCDLEGVDSLNIVLKLTSCEGKPVAKISDEPGKSLCKDEDYLQDLKEAFQLEQA